MENFSENNQETQNIESVDNTQNSANNPQKPMINVFAFFARSLGVFALFCAVFGIFFASFICGGIAIVLAVLSKGYQTKMEKNAVIGLVAGCIAIAVQLSTLTFSVYKIIHVPEYREMFNSMYEQIYGEPVDESITDMLDEMGVSAQEGGFL